MLTITLFEGLTCDRNFVTPVNFFRVAFQVETATKALAAHRTLKQQDTEISDTETA